MYRGIVYKYTNILNGKCYIGETINQLKRHNDHINTSLKENPKQRIHKAFKKYGLDNFTYDILESIESSDKKELKKLLHEREVYYIEKFNSYGSSGYNDTVGGNDRDYVTKEIIAKRQKNINQFDLEGNFIKEWDSATIAADTLDLNFRCISACANNKQAAHGGFKWGFVGDINTLSFKYKSYEIDEFTKEGVYLTTYNNKHEILDKYNYNKKSLSGHLSGDCKTHKGFIYKYKNNDTK